MTANANANVAAILQLLNDALPAEARAYDVDQVPSPRPEEYLTVSLVRRFGGERRQCGGIGTTGYRLAVRAVSHVYIENVRANLQTASDALENARLVVDGKTSTPLQFETGRPATPDEGWFIGVINLTYVI